MLTELLPEDELCLLLARRDLAPEVERRVRKLIAGPLRWDAVWQRAEEHQVLPLIYRSLRTLEFQGVPDDVRQKLTENFRHNALRAMLFSAELERVVGLLSEAGIRVMPLKGVALAETLYGDPAYRVCSDTDILVPSADALRVRRLLVEHGYTSSFTEDFFVNHQFRTSADCPLFIEKGGLAYLLELHWTLLQHSQSDTEAMDDLWHEAHLREPTQGSIYALSSEWQFLYLATHAAYHRWQTLKWVADLRDVCAATTIDWAVVQAKAERFHLNRVVGMTLTVLKVFYGMAAPAPLASTPLPSDVRLFPHSLAEDQAWDAPLFQAQLLNRPTEKLRWFLEMFFVARMADRMFVKLPPSLDFLYFVLRPLRLLGKWSRLYFLAAIRRVKRSR